MSDNIIVMNLTELTFPFRCGVDHLLQAKEVGFWDGRAVVHLVVGLIEIFAIPLNYIIALFDARITQALSRPLPLPQRTFRPIEPQPEHRQAQQATLCSCTEMVKTAQPSPLPIKNSEVVELALEIATPFVPSSRDIISQAIVKISTENRKNVVENVKLFLNLLESGSNRCYWTSEYKVGLLEVVADLSADERDSVIKHACSLANKRFCRSFTPKTVLDCIAAVAAIPANERDGVISLVCSLREQLNASYYNLDSVTELGRVVAAIPANERDGVISLVCSSIKQAYESYYDSDQIKFAYRDYDLKQALKCIETFNRILYNSGISADEKKGVIKNILSLAANQKIPDHCITSIKEALLRIPANERDSVVGFALRVSDPMMHMKDKIDCIIGVLFTSSLERENVVKNVQLLIKRMASSAPRHSVICVFQRVPISERDTVCSLVLKVMPQLPADGERIASLVKAIANVKSDTRDDVIEKAQMVFTPGMDGFDRVTIIESFTRFPANERDRDDVIQKAQRVFTPGMGGNARATIIANLAYLPANERDDVIEKAQMVFTPGMHGDDRAGIINNLTSLNTAERADYVARMLNDNNAPLHMNEQEARQAMRFGVNVHEGKRDENTKEAIELLRNHQGDITPDLIDAAVKEFKSYFNARIMSDKDRRLASHALLGPKDNEPYGCLLDKEPFSILGLEMTGEEVLGRHWIYASSLGEPEQTNAKLGMIGALKTSYVDEDCDSDRVCNQGKTQRFVVCVLSGRLAGVKVENVDVDVVTTRQAITMFFNMEAHRALEGDALVNAARLFLNQNPNIHDQNAFMDEINKINNLRAPD